MSSNFLAATVPYSAYQDPGQGTFLSPGQVPHWERMSDAQLIDHPQMFGMGQSDVGARDLQQIVAVVGIGAAIYFAYQLLS